MWTLCALVVARRLVVGGHPVSADHAPFVVRLYDRNLEYGFCGGSLVAPRTVLTAAHCVDNRTDLLYVGTYQTITHARPNERDSDVVEVTATTIHPAYDANTLAHDLALLTLARQPAGPYVATVAIDRNATYWPQTSSAPLQTAYVLGYGADIYRGAQSVVLEMGHVHLRERAHCDALFGTDLDASSGCAYLDADACSGDSGGPLVVVDRGRAVQVGVVSWGTGVCGTATVYALVADPTFLGALTAASYDASTDDADACECDCSSNGVSVEPDCGCRAHRGATNSFCYVRGATCADATHSVVYMGALYRACEPQPDAPPAPPKLPPPPLCAELRRQYMAAGCCE